MKDKVLILGANGFIGKSIDNHFRNNDFEVSSPSRVELDLLSKNCNEYPIQNCHVIYAAGIPSSKKNDLASYKENIRMIENLLNNARALISFTFLSSVEVYGSSFEGKLNESSPLDPLNLYAESKIVCEEMILKKFTNIQTNILRLPGVYGINSTHGLLGIIKKKLKSREVTKISNDGRDLRDFLFVEDIGHIIEILIKSNQRKCLNIATGDSSTVKDICNIIKELNNKFSVSYQHKSEGNFNLIFDTKNLQKELKNYELTSIKKGIFKSF